jgi:hypothetical protein
MHTEFLTRRSITKLPFRRPRKRLEDNIMVDPGEVNMWDWEINSSGFEPCPMSVFRVSSMKSSGSDITVLVSKPFGVYKSYGNEISLEIDVEGMEG